MNAADLLSTLDHWGFSMARVLLTVLWQSSIVFAAVAALSWLLRKRRAGVRHGLWLAALLVAPVLPLLTTVVSQAGAPQAPVSVLPTYTEPAPFPALASEPAPAPTIPPDLSEREMLAPEVHVSVWSYPWALLLVGYALGLALFLGWVALGRIRIAQWIRSASPVTDAGVLAAFKAARERLGVTRDFPVLETGRIPAPVTAGLLRPVVLLPGELAEGLSPVDIQSIAVHELAHIARRDPFILSVIALVRAALFFHPLVWLACRQVSLLAEQAADDAVLDVTGEPVAYARMLARLAENLRRRALTTELAAGIVLSKSAFLRRVEAILSDRRDQLRRFSRRALALTILAALLSLFLASALPLAEKGSAPTKQESGALTQEPASPTTPESKVRGALTTAEQALRDKLARHVTFQFVDTPLEAVVEFIRNASGANVVVDQRVLTAAGPGGKRVTLTRTDIPVEDALGLIVKAVGLDWVLYRGVVFISEESRLKDLEKREQWLPEVTPEGEAVRAKFDRPVTLSFADTPLEAAVDFFHNACDMGFVVDQRVLADAGPGGKRVALTLSKVPLQDALDIMLTMLGLEWTVRDGSVHISLKKPEPPAAAARGGRALPTASDAAVSAPLGEKELGFDEIAQGIIASRSTLRSMRVRYEVSYRGTNWGLMEGEDGRQVSRDQYAGSHELAVNNISNDSLWHQEKLRWYLRCPLPSYGPEADQVTAFDGEYQWCLYQPRSRRPLGTVSAKVNDSWFAWNSRIFDIACLVYHDTWEHALKTGTLVLERKEAVDGHQCSVLEGRVCVLPDTGFAGYPVKVWIDPARGFAIVRLEAYSRTNGELETFSSYDVLEMKKGAPNLWVPVHVLFRHGKEIVVKDITVNERLPDDLFTIKFPDGTKVQDDRRDRSYTVVNVPTPAEPRQKAEIGGPAPELLLEKGAGVTLSQFGGRQVVIAFVSIYSRPCVKVLDDLKALQEKQGADKLGVIAVHDRTATPEEIEQFRKDHGIPFPILRVPDAPRDGWDSATFRAYGVTALPTVIRIDTEGKVESVGAGSP